MTNEKFCARLSSFSAPHDERHESVFSLTPYDNQSSLGDGVARIRADAHTPRPNDVTHSCNVDCVVVNASQCTDPLYDRRDVTTDATVSTAVGDSPGSYGNPLYRRHQVVHGGHRAGPSLIHNLSTLTSLPVTEHGNRESETTPFAHVPSRSRVAVPANSPHRRQTGGGACTASEVRSATTMTRWQPLVPSHTRVKNGVALPEPLARYDCKSNEMARVLHCRLSGWGGGTGRCGRTCCHDNTAQSRNASIVNGSDSISNTFATHSSLGHSRCSSAQGSNDTTASTAVSGGSRVTSAHPWRKESGTSSTMTTTRMNADAEDVSEQSSTSSSLSSSSGASREVPSEQLFVDEFGFVVDEEAKLRDEMYIERIDGKRMAQRDAKWSQMVVAWRRTRTRFAEQLKKRCRKGIPGRFRGVSWQLLLGSRHKPNAPENVDVYMSLRNKALADSEVDFVIARDRARTFPTHVFFQEDGGVGQTFLCNVLHAYAAVDPEVGYVQGMAFLVAALSTQMGEEECFWALHAMMYHSRISMREMFRVGFPLLQQSFYQLKQLMLRFTPRLSRHLDTLMIDPSLYAVQWFMTVFVYHFPFRTVLRIWDIFFCEGWKIVFRVAIALLKWEEDHLLKLPFDECVMALRQIHEGKDSKKIIRRALQIKFKRSDLDSYSNAYWKSVS